MLAIDYYLCKYHIDDIYHDYYYLNDSTINKYDEAYYGLPPKPVEEIIIEPSIIHTPFISSSDYYDNYLMIYKWLIKVDEWYLNDKTVDKYNEEYYY
mgnify:CR=1 FL=1|jgi:hypothetical protein